MDLGSAVDWAKALALMVGVGTLIAAVWKLARAASSLELSVAAMTASQQALGHQLENHLAAFQEYQRDQARTVADLQSAINRLTWEVNRTRGDGT